MGAWQIGLEDYVDEEGAGAWERAFGRGGGVSHWVSAARGASARVQRDDGLVEQRRADDVASCKLRAHEGKRGGGRSSQSVVGGCESGACVGLG